MTALAKDARDAQDSMWRPGRSSCCSRPTVVAAWTGAVDDGAAAQRAPLRARSRAAAARLAGCGRFLAALLVAGAAAALAVQQLQQRRRRRDERQRRRPVHLGPTSTPTDRSAPEGERDNGAPWRWTQSSTRWTTQRYTRRGAREGRRRRRALPSVAPAARARSRLHRHAGVPGEDPARELADRAFSRRLSSPRGERRDHVPYPLTASPAATSCPGRRACRRASRPRMNEVQAVSA